jgi:protoheme IX farnesyltransferase
LLFLWTPAHFWALAFFYKDDYAASSTPMLPVFLTARQSAWWIFIHALGTGLAALLLAVHPALGLIYLTPVSVFALLMVAHGIILIRTPERKRAIRLFVVTNIFLLVVFVTIIVASVFNQVLSI